MIKEALFSLSLMASPAQPLDQQPPCGEPTPRADNTMMVLNCGNFRLENDPDATRFPNRRDYIVAYANRPSRLTDVLQWVHNLHYGLDEAEAYLNRIGCHPQIAPDVAPLERTRTFEVPNRAECLPNFPPLTTQQ